MRRLTKSLIMSAIVVGQQKIDFRLSRKADKPPQMPKIQPINYETNY